MLDLIQAYENYLRKVKHASDNTISSYMRDIRQFSQWLNINEGMIMENIVAQMLRTNGHRLYFYSRCDNENRANHMEIDFLIQKPTISNRHNISPIEVKSSTRDTLTSLGKFVKKYNSQLHVPYVIHYQDLKYENGIVFLPIYMTSFL